MIVCFRYMFLNRMRIKQLSLSLSGKKSKMNSKKYYIRYTIVPIGVVAVIFYGTCLMNTGDIPKIESPVPLDKIAHFGMFFLLAAINSYEYDRLYKGNPQKTKWLLWGLLIPIIYGGIIELLQKSYFKRDAEWGDFVADALGAICGMLLVIYFLKIRKNRKKKLSL